VKRNLTIALDEETALWARIEAARRDISVSRFIADLLRERMDRTGGYDESMKEFLSRRASRLKGAKDRYPGRDELHDRAGLR
jgi:hypothetical protein